MADGVVADGVDELPDDGTVGALLRRAAQERPDHPALVEAREDGRRATWAEVDAETDRVAAGLAAEGVLAGYRVALVLANRVELVTAHLGVLRAGAVSVPLDPRMDEDELRRALEDSGARVVVADGATVTAVRAAAARLGSPPRLVVVGATLRPGERGWDQLVSGARAARPVPVRADPEALAVLLYTSGTSGRPRAAMISHRALRANVDQVAAMEHPLTTADDVLLAVLPLCHVYGVGPVLGAVLKQAATLVLAERFDERGTLDDVVEHGCTVLPLAPPVFPRWLRVPDLRQRLGGVRLVLSGTAPLDAELVEAFSAAAGVEVHQGYGLTEAAGVVTSTHVALDPSPGSVGTPLPGVELRLRDEQGREPVPGDLGEVELRGPNLFDGYWPDGADGPGEDGWWATGDVGHLDGRGNLVLVDRLAEVVVVNGFTVYPAEVEEVLAEVPGVAEVAVVGTPDPATGEAVVAWVRPEDPDAVAHPDELRAALAAHAEDRLARFKRPVRTEVVAELERTPTGKVRKGRLRGLERRRARGVLDL